MQGKAIYTFVGLQPNGQLIDADGQQVEIDTDNVEESVFTHELITHIPVDLRSKVVAISRWSKRVCYPVSLPNLGPRPAITDWLILLDLDGVVNMTPLYKDHQVELYPDVQELSFYSFTHNQYYPFRWSPSVVQSINRWATRAEIRWATSWMHIARYILAPLIGLHDFEPICDRTKRWENPNLIPNDVLSRDVIWIDDEIDIWWRDMKHLRNHAKSLRVMNTSGWGTTFSGLKPNHVKQVDEWLGL